MSWSEPVRRVTEERLVGPEPHRRGVRPAAMSHLRRIRVPSILAVSAALLMVACSASPGTSLGPAASGAVSSAAPSAAPSGSAVPVGTIEHKTGATDVLLRFEEGGGFVMPAFFATSVPHFTLYGDGTIVFRDPMLETPPPQGSAFVMNPMRTAKMSEEQVQELLAYALGEGGLAGARADYGNDMVADASTAVFTIDAGGIKKDVSVYALGMEVPAGQPGAADGPARAAFQKLGQTLTSIDAGGTIPTDVYEPAGYRGILLDAQGVVAPDIKDWPWPDVAVTDFVGDADPNGIGFPHRTMSTAEIEALGVTGYEGGYQGAVVRAPDGKIYTFSLRPLLPEETE